MKQFVVLEEEDLVELISFKYNTNKVKVFAVADEQGKKRAKVEIVFEEEDLVELISTEYNIDKEAIEVKTADEQGKVEVVIPAID